MKIKYLVCYIIVSCIAFSTLNESFASDVKKSDYERRDRLILCHIKIGDFKINNFKLTGEVLKNILYGAWEIDEYESVKFNKNGTFIVMDWEDSDKGDMLYKGKWKTEDNAIVFMVDGSKKWQKCLIKRVILKDLRKHKFKYDYSLTFFLEKVKFKSIYRDGIFLYGGMSTEVFTPKYTKKAEITKNDKKEIKKKK